jgi:hypothetical protein
VVKPRCVGVFVAVGFVAISVAAARIYREDLPRVTASRNRLGHGLVAKINGKRRLRACEALGWILADYSRPRRAPAPRRGERARVCVSPFLLSSTRLQVHKE